MLKFLRLSDHVVVTELDIDPLCTIPSPNFRPDESLYQQIAITDQPAYDQYTQKLEELPPVQIDDIWMEQWQVVELEGEELEQAQAQKVADEQAARAALKITMRQARLQLLTMDVYDTVNAALETMPQAAQIEWEYASEVERMNPLIPAMQGLLGWDDEAADEFFREAASR